VRDAVPLPAGRDTFELGQRAVVAALEHDHAIPVCLVRLNEHLAHDSSFVDWHAIVPTTLDSLRAIGSPYLTGVA
jgi:hypothetical protein